ncbi:MAG: hypothetical protein KBA60_06280 [Flavobacteriales bacterium]|nr:hypothetical protein [Flavobacteriales bacterium]MBP6643628.1 hypothetical protein [Flavobacteriales bacterium]MBP7155595.1 hypothetical protein [Flavobacteriales bacterium]HQV74859.1 hypothetical protein [Flavobacteriales bacterium]HQW40800.1 hypothetical protein [Flavobacteriales bacterium]
MKTLLTTLLLLFTATSFSQNTIWSHAIGNWRNGPVVYITPLIETTEQFTTPMLLEHYQEEFPELKGATDIDVLRFGTPEEGNESRRTLQAKYGMRKLEVVMLELPKERQIEEPIKKE